MRFLFAFLLQWITTSVGLWLAMTLFGIPMGNGEGDATSIAGTYLLAGFILSLINIFIRPIVSILSLPITLMTLGLFTLVINGFMVWLALHMTDGISMSFFDSILAGVIIGIVNFVIGRVIGVLNSDEKGENDE